jgi:phosphatidate cytidylyltransferase
LLRTRFITALILFPIVAILVYLGGWFFFAALAGMALLATWEFVHMMQVKGHKPHLLLAFGFALVPLLSMQAPEQRFFISTISILFVISLVWQLFQADSTAPVVDWALTIVGCYIGLGLGHLFGLRLLAEGIAWVWIALLSTWGCDSLAYFVGRAVGKRKFWPRLSPKKTWEGILGGVGGGMLGGFLVSLFSSIPLVHALIIGLLVSIAAPLGDVSISMMKRYAGVKDSSHLIPGHGGMLDRIDSLLFVAIVVFYYATWVVV